MMRLLRSAPLALLQLLLMCASARAYVRTDEWFFGDETWVDGASINLRYLGHLGSSTEVNAPLGGYYLEAQYGLWWNHFLEIHASLSHSVSSSEFWGIGAGARLNILEFSKANALEFAGESTAGLRCVETHRGLLAVGLRSILLHLDAGFDQYFFTDSSAGILYPGSQNGIEWGGGVQWGPNFRISGISRLYIDTTALFIRLNGISYTAPYVGLGANF